MSRTARRFSWRIGVVVVVLAAGCNSNLAPTPARWFNTSAFPGLVPDTASAYASARLDYELDSPDGKVLRLTRCEEVENLKDTEVAPAQYPLLRMLRLNCLALQRFSQSAAAQRTFLPGKLTLPLLQQLPADAVPKLNQEDLGRRSGKLLSVLEPSINIEVLDDFSVRTTTPEEATTYIVMGRADFDHDGTEDLLVRVESSPADGADPATDLLLLTRTHRDGPIRVIWRQ